MFKKKKTRNKNEGTSLAGKGLSKTKKLGSELLETGERIKHK